MSRVLGGNRRISAFALLVLSVLFIGIGCAGDQGLAGPQGPQGPQGPAGAVRPEGATERDFLKPVYYPNIATDHH